MRRRAALRAVRRRRSLSRILSARPTGGRSSHSSRPPVARGIQRPTRGNERATRVRPCDRTSLLHGLAPGGVYRASVLTNGPGELLPHRFTLAATLASRGGFFSVALSADHSAPPLTATLPCGVRTFLVPSRNVTRLLDLLRRTARRSPNCQLASLCVGGQCRMRWQLGHRITCSFRWI